MSLDLETKSFIKTVQVLSAAHTLSAVADVVRTAARNIVKADGATFMLVEGDRCRYVDEDAIEPLFKGQTFPIKECIGGWSVLNKQAAIIPNIYDDPRILTHAFTSTFVKSLAMIPIKLENPLGAIGVYWKRETVPNQEQMEMLQALADTVGVALENVDLYSNIQKNLMDVTEQNKAKDEFLMTVSHELRTPLNAILGWSELLASGDVTGPQANKGFETIVRNAKKQSRIINDLFDNSKISLGRINLETQPLDLISLLNQTLNALKFSAEKKSVHLTFKNEARNVLVVGDSMRLEQVFSNLIENAIKFSSLNQMIDVSVKLEKNHVVVSIKDDGSGIEPSFLPFIFEKFKQGDFCLSKKSGGLGLGLAIVRHLVKAHGGDVKVYSAGIGCGTTALVTLPLYQTN